MQFDSIKLEQLFKDFYTLTGIHIALFDDELSEVLRYPYKACAFCSLVRSDKNMDMRCKESDAYAFKKCNETQSRYTYRCHMNLIETATPVFFGNAVIGYIMIGQISDAQSSFDSIKHKLPPSQLQDAQELYQSIAFVSDEKIGAAAHILDACAKYLYLSKLITAQNKSLPTRIEKYLNDNISKNVTVDELCTFLHTSRVELYHIFKLFYGKSVADTVRHKKLEYAAELLRTTAKSITDISDLCGMNDYNYFSKVFKKTYGISAGHYRKSFSTKDNNL